MANQQAHIIVSATDRFSGVLINAAARLETLNKRLAKSSQVSQALGLVGEQLAPRWKKATDAFDGMRRAAQLTAGVTLAVGAGGVALVKFAKSGADAADKVGDLAGRYRVSSQLIQVAGALVEESGGDMESAAKAIGKLTQSMNEAINGGEEQAAAFAGVGLSIADLRKLRPEEVLARMADAFKGSNKDLAKQAVLLKLMGKDGTVAMEALNQGGQAWRDKLQEMLDDGRIFSAQQLQNADAFDKAWQRAVGAFEGVKNLLGLDLAQALLPVIDATREWLKANREIIRDKFAEFLARLPELLESVWSAAQIVFQAFAVLARVLQFLAGTFGAANIAIGAALLALVPLGISLGKAAVAVFGLGRAVLVAMGPVGILAAAVVALAALVIANWDTIVETVSNAWDRIKSIFEVSFLDGLVQAFLESFQIIANGILGIIKSIPIISEIPAVKNLKPLTFAGERFSSLARGGRSAQTDPGFITAAQAAQAQRQDISNSISIRIDSDGRPRVTDLRRGSPQTQLDVSTGLAFVGA